MSVEAVVFDWGGTLTRWHDIDFEAEAVALAAAATDRDDQTSARLLAAAGEVWARSRDHQRSATVADVFAAAGLEHDADLLADYWDFWEPHTLTDPEVEPLWRRLRADGIKVGVLSNTLWPRGVHRGFFARDGVLDLIDGDVYSSEIAWTKPSPHAFRAALDAVGVSDPGRAVYVGDRLFDDVWGAQQAGLRAIHVPHSAIPEVQRGHTDGVPDAVATTLSDIPALIADW